MAWTDPVVAGEELIRSAIRSPNYVPGQTGWSIRQDGSAEFTDVAVTVSGTSSGLQVVRSSDGAPVGSINEDGVISGQALSIATDDIEINGEQLSARFTRETSPWKVYGRSDSITRAGTGTLGIFEVAFDAPTTGLYTIWGKVSFYSESDRDLIIVGVRDGGSSKPSSTSPAILYSSGEGPVSYLGACQVIFGIVSLTAGLHRLLLTCAGYSSTVHVTGECILSVAMFDQTLPNLAISNDGSGGSSTQVQTYTTIYGSTWSGTYNGSGAYESYYGVDVHQGSYDGTAANNQKGMIGFPYGTIQSDLSGATVLSCKVGLYAYHWYWNSGGVGIIGTHNQTTRPATFSGTTGRIFSTGWPKPGFREVDLTVGIGNEFKAGTSKGIVLGPGASNAVDYYGKFYGYNTTWNPYLAITYQK
jgi:hypothetical protein